MAKCLKIFLLKNHLTVVNSLPLCKGTMTRARMRKGILVQSVLDFYVVCERVLASVTEMEIDTDKKYILTNFQGVKAGGKAVNTDHLTTLLKVNLKVLPEKPNRIEMFNFKDINGQEKLKISTSETNDFSQCFMSKNSVNHQAADWMKVLFTHCARSFPKIRIRKKTLKVSAASRLIDQRRKLLKTETEDTKEVIDITEKNAEILTEEGRSKAYKFRQFCDQDNTLNVREMWNLKKKTWPKKKNSLPVGKKNHKGKFVTAPEDLRKLLLKEYKERLRPRQIHPKMKMAKSMRLKLIKLKLEMAKKSQSEPFQMDDLEIVLKNLKSGKSRDPKGISREIFQPSIIGSNLKQSLLTLFNKIKQQGTIPEFMKETCISTIPKKGPKSELKNERGMFLVNTVRGLLMKLLHNSEARMINNNMSDSNIGGRKKKSCINHIWVPNSIIHEQLNSQSNKPIILQQYDYQQMFDSMNLKEACSDLYDIGLASDKLQLVYNANKNVRVKVKTSSGITKETIMKELVMQGDIWASTMASVQCDAFGKELLEEEASFFYINIKIKFQ